MLAALAVLAATTPSPRDTLNVVRIGGYGAYVDGSKLVGHGSRQRYDGGELGIDLDLVRIPREGIGAELRLQTGGVMTTGADRVGRFGTIDFALDASIYRGTTFGLCAGAGLGIEIGRHEFTERVRFYPLAALRARWFPDDALSFHLNVHFIPITTAEKDRELRAELGIGYRALFLGARTTVSAFTAGDPRRTYGELGLGLIAGAAFY